MRHIILPAQRSAVEKLDIPLGTLDLMILTILVREPMHGYGISQRLTVLSHDHSTSILDRSFPRSIVWSKTAS
jgi:hypothetical protein